MKPFERYHPMMTAHYTLDWLTTFTVKAIFQLRQDATVAQTSRRKADTAMTQTVRYVNQVMRNVMHNQQLTWGIRDRQTQNFLGLFEFKDFNALEKSAELHFEFLPDTDTHAMLVEISTYMTRFAFDELGCQRLKVILTPAQTEAKQALLASGFQFCEKLAVLDQTQTIPLMVYDQTSSKQP